MSKVIKILVRSLSVVVLTFLGVMLLLSAVVEIPSVQDYIVDKATGIISKKLGTKVSIGHVSIKFISSASIDDLYVADFHGDTLLYVGKLTAGIRNPGLSGGDILLGKVGLENTRFYLHQTAEGVSNLAEILEKLKSDKEKEKGGDFVLRASSIDIRDLGFRYYKLNPREKEYGVNFDDVEVERLDLQAEKISVIGDSVSMRINHIMVQEKSGFKVDDLSAADFNLSGRGLRFRELKITTPDSRVTMDYLNLVARSWNSFSDFTREVVIEAGIEPSDFSYRTVAYFAPGLQGWESVYREVTGEVSGPVAALKGNINRVNTLDTEVLGVRFAITGLPDVQNTNFRINIAGLHTNAQDALYIMHDITRRQIEGNTAQMMHRLGNISFSGDFDGTLSRFKANGELATSQGGAGINLAFAPGVKGRTGFEGRVAVHEFNAGALLDNDMLGRTTLSGQVKGSFGGGNLALDADAGLEKLVFNGYAYSDVAMEGHIENRYFQGKVSSADPNIDFDFDGTLDFSDSLPRYDFNLALRNADLHKLGFNKRDTTSLISCRLTAQASGNTLDNLNGNVTVDDMLYINHLDSVRTGRMLLTGNNSSLSHLVSFQSSFADVQLSSRLGYSDLLKYLTGTIQKYIPTLASGKTISGNGTATALADAGQFYLLKMNVKEANNVAGAILPGLILANGTQLSFMLNPYAEQLSLMLQSEYIEYKSNFVSDLNLNSRNQGDSLSLFIRAEDMYASGFYMPDFSVIGGVKEDRVNVSARFTDNQNRISALVSAQADFRKTASGMRQIAMRINPSYITNREQTWRLSSGEVLYDSTRIDIERLRIASSNGELTAEGILSRSREDTMHLDILNFNMQPFTQFTQRRGYTISGLTNGHADIVSALDKGIFTANINFDSLKFNNVGLPPLTFDARWDFQNERARVTLTDRAKADTLVQAYYSPVDKRYMADADLRGVDLSLIDPLLSGVLRGTRGSADVALRIVSDQGNPNMNGTVKIPALTTTVDFTGVAYSLADAVVEVKDNNFILRTTNVKDPAGNQGAFDATFALGRGLTNYNYELRVRPQSMMVLNTTVEDNDLFNGRVFATGAATIKGDKRGVAMNVTATTAGSSSFWMSLSSKGNIADADFITFIPYKQPQTDSSYYQQRKQEIISNGTKNSISSAASTLAIDMALSVLPNTDFQLVIDPAMGKGIKAQGNGQLNITVNPRNGDFNMYGDYQITDGSYNLNLEKLIDRNFTIQPGSSIRWTGDPADAILDVTALYKVRSASLTPLVGTDSPISNNTINVDCSIMLTDRLSKPTINFAVDASDASAETQNLVMNALNTPELMSTQFLWLVAFNSFYSDNSGQSLGTMSGSATAFDFLSGQLSNMLSSDRFKFGFKYHPGDEMNSEEYVISGSWILANQRLFFDVEGNYDTEPSAAASNNASGFSGDFAIRYLVDKTGNVQAKLFSRTIDTYDENQGLQETGVGLYYYEDFNTVKDIARNLRSRFSFRSKRKKQEQAAKADTIQTDTTTLDKTMINQTNN